MITKTDFKILAAILIAIFAGIVVFILCGGPPHDAALARRFETNRSVFEELRDMMREDVQRHNISEIAEWGLRKPGQGVPRGPEENALSKERYKMYLSLMKKAVVGVCIHTGG